MSKKLQLMAFDMGASNGRCILGDFDGKTVSMKELHRFENAYSDISGVMYWNIIDLYNQMKIGFGKYKLEYGNNLSSFGIDTWGVDFGLIDKNGHLIGLPRSYRYSSDDDVISLSKAINVDKIYGRTGEACEVYTTLCQLYKRKREGDSALDSAKTLLMMPDLLGYLFTGVKKTDFTIATTTMMYNPFLNDWDRETCSELNIDSDILTEIDMPGQIRGKLSEPISAEIGINEILYSSVGSHDTASAVAAIPGKGNFVFCSSGTWSLIGIESEKPIINEKIRKMGFSNEGTVQGGFRILKNIMGLWHIQECRREWQSRGIALSWNDIVNAAEKAEPLKRIIDTDSSDFYAGGKMIEKINSYLIRTGQKPAETIGETARCVYDSLALKYRWVCECLSEIKGEKIDSMNIVGGGIKNVLLNQLISDSIGVPVITGPVEGAAIGNILTQAMALGEIADIDQLRDVVRASETVQIYESNHSDIWDEAYNKLKELI